MITLKQLHYALAVEKTLHFKNAAKACHVSQSALSTAITTLEQQLGIIIFERNNKQVLITNTGADFLRKTRQITLQADELTLLAQTGKSLLTRPMTIGVIPTIAPYLLPIVLPAVRAQYPDFKLRIIEQQSHQLLAQVRTGELDAAILALPYPIDGLLAFEFWQEDFYWISHKAHCPNHLREINSADLELASLMLLKEGHCLKDHALAACGNHAQHIDNSFDATSLHTLVQMVAGKLGSTLVPEMALTQLVHCQAELSAVHLNEPGPHRRIAFIVRPNYVGTANVDELIKIFQQQLTANNQQ